MRTTMATENNNKTLNVPNLRFPKFSGEWTKTTLGKIGETFNGLTGKSGSDFGQGSPYITYKSIFDNSKIDLSRVEYVTITDAERKKQTQNEVQYGDIFFTTSSETPDEVGMTSVLLDEVKDCYLNSFCFGYRLNSITDVLPEYMRFYLRSNTIRRRLFVLAQGSTRFNISKGEVMGLTIKLPGTAEQRKIAQLLTMIEDRIATQIKIIEKLESLIKGLCQTLFNFEEYTTYFLGDICSITTGKLDANAMVEDGKYPFFTCAEDVFSIDEYAFDTEALLISGNGANLGYIHYYNGKFNAYQRTYVLDKFAIDINYVRLYLESFLKYRIEQEKNSGNTPYIVLGTLSKMKIKVPNTITQQKISQSIASLKEKLSIEKQSLKKYEEQKKYLLSNLFI